MYKLLIVEDERWEREGLADFLDWKSYNIEIAATACDGIDGLEKALEICPDIIITDIKMPGIDGIAMSKKIKEVLPDVKIIILTGYDDFQYAREAIDFQASGYILKIMDEEELIQIIKKVVRECDKERGRLEQEKRMNDKLAESLEASRITFFMDILEGRLSENSLSEQIAYFGMASQTEDDFIVAIVKLLRGKQTDMNINLEVLYEAIAGELDAQEVFSLRNGGREEIILCIANGEGTEHLREALQEICREIERKSEAGITIGLGKAAKGICSLRSSYWTARQAVNFAAFRQLSGVMSYHEMEELNFSFTHSINEFLLQGSYFSKQLVHALRSLDHDRTFELVGEMFRHIRSEEGADRDFIVNYLQNVINEVCIMTYQLNREFEQKNAHNILFGDGNENHQNLKDMEQSVENFIRKAIEGISKKRLSKDELIVKKVIKLVEDKYASSDICLKTLAGEVYLSPNYLGSIFKKSTGRSINDYLNEYRMERARELLMSPANKVGWVAASVGMPNTSYFCTVFKSKYGVAPGEFQDSIAEA